MPHAPCSMPHAPCSMLHAFQGYVFYNFLAGARSVGCMGFWGPRIPIQ
ncbi:MAG: hypothetical protein F6J93_14885 [Oscillatoria sp. SIO1A7]|nr:hypothetical protein [Oscillatoria sp. SIO1A7]